MRKIFYTILCILCFFLLINNVSAKTLKEVKDELNRDIANRNALIQRQKDVQNNIKNAQGDISNLEEEIEKYEQEIEETLAEIVKLRNSAYNKMSNSEKVTTNNKLSNELSKLMAIAENYPDLKANENFRDLSNQLSKVEEDIANSRKYYNGAVRVYNNKVHP